MSRTSDVNHEASTTVVRSTIPARCRTRPGTAREPSTHRWHRRGFERRAQNGSRPDVGAATSAIAASSCGRGGWASRRSGGADATVAGAAAVAASRRRRRGPPLGGAASRAGRRRGPAMTTARRSSPTRWSPSVPGEQRRRALSQPSSGEATKIDEYAPVSIPTSRAMANSRRVTCRTHRRRRAAATARAGMRPGWC